MRGSPTAVIPFSPSRLLEPDRYGQEDVGKKMTMGVHQKQNKRKTMDKKTNELTPIRRIHHRSNAANIHHRAPRLHQQLPKPLRNRQDAPKIDLKHPPPLVQIRIHQRARIPPPAIVAQHVQALSLRLLLHRRHARGNGFRGCHVEGQEAHVRDGGKMLDLGERARGREDVVGGGAGKGEGKRGADAAFGAAGDEGVFGGGGTHGCRYRRERTAWLMDGALRWLDKYDATKIRSSNSQLSWQIRRSYQMEQKEARAVI